MQNKILRKGLIIGIIILFVGVSVVSSANGINSDIKEKSKEIPVKKPMEIYSEIITYIIGFGYEGEITIKSSGIGIFKHVELWSDTYFDITGIRRSNIFPVLYGNSTNHIIAPRCLIIFFDHISPGEEMFKAIALGNIEWE